MIDINFTKKYIKINDYEESRPTYSLVTSIEWIERKPIKFKSDVIITMILFSRLPQNNN